jgi:outer membrane protein OmpA-like peptidoglycan-associated protein
MTKSVKFFGIAATTIGAVLTMTAGLASAAEAVSTNTIINSLKSPEATAMTTRSLSFDPNRAEKKTREVTFINSMRNRSTRSLSSSERNELQTMTADKPKIDLEINFEYNSAEISQASMPSVQELGKALSDPNLKGGTFVVAGHTDGIGSDGFNQDLSERRADTIKRYLVDKYGLTGKDLVAVGYGKTKLKNTADPSAPVNRRVQVVNMDAKTAAK